MIKTVAERIELQTKKLIEDMSKLDICDKVYSVYVQSQAADHDSILLTGLHGYQYQDEIIKHHPDTKHPIIIIGSNKQRMKYADEFATIVELEDIQYIAKNNMPILWDSYAIIRLAHAGSLIKQDLKMLQRLRETLL